MINRRKFMALTGMGAVALAVKPLLSLSQENDGWRSFKEKMPDHLSAIEVKTEFGYRLIGLMLDETEPNQGHIRVLEWTSIQGTPHSPTPCPGAIHNLCVKFWCWRPAKQEQMPWLSFKELLPEAKQIIYVKDQVEASDFGRFTNSPVKNYGYIRLFGMVEPKGWCALPEFVRTNEDYWLWQPSVWNPQTATEFEQTAGKNT